MGCPSRLPTDRVIRRRNRAAGRAQGRTVAGSVFTGFDQPCPDAGAGPCLFTVTGDMNIPIAFAPATYTSYFAEGVKSDFFDLHFALANESTEPSAGERPLPVSRRHEPGGTRAARAAEVRCRVGALGNGPSGEFSTVVESYRRWPSNAR